MGTLLLKLAGPLQSWGSDSRFTERKTRHEPTKSGVVGLLASALGRRRTDDVDDLNSFKFGVRIDQPGASVCDYQLMHVWEKTPRVWKPVEGKPSRRYYLSDAVFVAAFEMPDEKLDECTDALLHPAFPLYLGRRSCPPADKVLLDAMPGVKLMDALALVPWQASEWYQRRQRRWGKVPERLTVYRDVLPSEHNAYGETVRDVPVSFFPEYRRYSWRTVVRDEVKNPNVSEEAIPTSHDPWAVLDEEGS